MFVLAMGLLAAGWEAYKKWGPQDGGDILGWLDPAASPVLVAGPRRWLARG